MDWPLGLMAGNRGETHDTQEMKVGNDPLTLQESRASLYQEGQAMSV